MKTGLIKFSLILIFGTIVIVVMLNHQEKSPYFSKEELESHIVSTDAAYKACSSQKNMSDEEKSACEYKGFLKKHLTEARKEQELNQIMKDLAK